MFLQVFYLLTFASYYIHIAYSKQLWLINIYQQFVATFE